MQPKIFKSLIYILFSSILFFHCQAKRNQTVARVDNQTIKYSEFVESLLKSYPNNNIEDIEYETRLAHLNTMIDKKLIYVAAQRAGLAQREDLRAILDDEEMRFSYVHLLDREIIDKVIPESDLKESYKYNKFNLNIQRFTFPLSPTARVAQKDSMLNKVQEIRLRLLKGEDFESVAYKESLATEGTNTGTPEVLNWQHARTDKDLFRALARLPLRTISRPIRTAEGYYIARVLEKQPQEVKDYASEREKIRNALIRQRYEQLNERFEVYKADILKKYDVQIQDQNVEFLVVRVKEAVEPGPNVIPPDKIQFDKLTDADKEKALVTFNGGAITIHRAIDLLKRLRATRSTVPVFSNPQAVNRYLDMIIPQEVLVVEAFRRKTNKSAHVQKSLAESTERLLSEEMERTEVNAKATPTEEDLMAYYMANYEKYVNEATFKVQEIFVSDENLAREISKRARAGEKFDRLVEKYSQRSQYKKDQGVMGFITRNQFGEIGKTAAQMIVGSISEPVNLGKNWSIIKLLEIKPATFKTFDEARGMVLQELKPKKLSERKELWLKETRAQIQVAIYEKVLSQ